MKGEKIFTFHKSLQSTGILQDSYFVQANKKEFKEMEPRYIESLCNKNDIPQCGTKQQIFNGTI